MYINVYVHMYIYLHGIIYYVYISLANIARPYVCTCTVCMCVFVCILACTEGISKNNVTEAEERIRVMGFPGQVMKVKSLVYSSELCINGNTGIRAVSLDLGWVQSYARS